MAPDPLFILAPPRSFTSIICGMLGQHPQLYGLPEVNLMAADTYKDLGRVYSLRPGFRHGLLRAIAQLGLAEQTEQNVMAARTWLEEQATVSTADLYRDLMAWAEPKRLVDKSPIYVFTPGTLARMRAAFPGARYIHLTRHPRPTCESIYKLRGVVQEGLKNLQQFIAQARKQTSSQYERLAQIDDPESLWLKPHLRILEYLEEIPAEQHLRIRGEDFMTDPDGHLRQITEWLGIRSDTEAIAAMKQPENSPFACYGPANARFGNDPSFLESPALREYRPKEYSLEGPLEGGSGAIFSDSIKEYAAYFGYG